MRSRISAPEIMKIYTLINSERTPDVPRRYTKTTRSFIHRGTAAADRKIVERRVTLLNSALYRVCRRFCDETWNSTERPKECCVRVHYCTWAPSAWARTLIRMSRNFKIFARSDRDSYKSIFKTLDSTLFRVVFVWISQNRYLQIFAIRSRGNSRINRFSSTSMPVWKLIVRVPL